MTIDVVVADANVLLSATLGHAALKVFTHHEVDVHVARFNADEVEEYLPRLASKYDLPVDVARLQWKVLPIHLHVEADYATEFDQALADLADRDPEDAHALALARTLEVPIWSNDKDLQGHGVMCYSTGQLLAILESRADV